MSPQPFVEPAPRTTALLARCDLCQTYYWSDYPHHCEVREQRVARIVLLVAATGLVVFWVLVVAGVTGRRPW